MLTVAVKEFVCDKQTTQERMNINCMKHKTTRGNQVSTYLIILCYALVKKKKGLVLCSSVSQSV